MILHGDFECVYVLQLVENERMEFVISGERIKIPNSTLKKKKRCVILIKGIIKYKAIYTSYMCFL